MNERALSARRIVTCDPARATSGNPLGAIDDGAIVYDSTVRWVGPRAELPSGVPVTDFGDRVVTPGLVDAHTHAAWMGSRHDEYAMRMSGADYRAIAAAGGGIVASHRAIAASTEDEIVETLAARLRRMALLGVTTCEVKSGYGLVEAEERKQLRAMNRVQARRDGPHVVRTFLALHALPPDQREKRAEYISHVADTLVGDVATEKLAEFVDAYVDANAFTVDEARRVCAAAKKGGLGVRMHVGQFADVGGAELCAEMQALSADHLENVGPAGIEALARANVAAVLLPIASFTLGQAPPPVAALRAAGVRLVVASDANPGTAPSESLPLAIALAVRMYGLTPAEAILGTTRIAAESLALSGRGAITKDAFADLVVWDLAHENAIVQPWGTPRTSVVLREGLPLTPA